MKRLFAALLISVLLLGAAAQASPLRVVGGEMARDAYLEAYPDRSVDVIPYEYDENGQSKARQMLFDNPDGWDVALIWSNDVSLAALDETGVLLDLNQDASFAQRAADLYPAIQNAVIIDGRLAAMPVWMTGAVQQLALCSADTIEKSTLTDILALLGVSDQNCPQTFAELCELGERYMALSAETRRGTAFSGDAMSGNPTANFLYRMIMLYTAQYYDPAGNIAYDTPVFQKAVADVDALAAALASDPKILYRKDGSTTIYGLVHDSGSALLSQYSTLLYLGIGDKMAVPARLLTAVVNINSDRQAEALDFVRCAIQCNQTEGDLTLLAHPDYEALVRQSYDESIAEQIQQKEPQEVIDALVQERDSGEYTSYYSREVIEQYRLNIAPRLTFPHIPRFDAYAIAEAYAAGQLDVDGLIAELTEVTKRSGT